jgi:hypothetical protein
MGHWHFSGPTSTVNPFIITLHVLCELSKLVNRERKIYSRESSQALRNEPGNGLLDAPDAY